MSLPQSGNKHGDDIAQKFCNKLSHAAVSDPNPQIESKSDAWFECRIYKNGVVVS